MDITPRSIIKGRNSDGTSFRFAEWDFATLSNIEFITLAFIFLTGLALCPFVAPLLTIFAILGFNGRLRLTYIVPIIFGTYFIYDALHGWLMLIAVSCFFSELITNALIMVNFASVITSIILLIFGGFLYDFITQPMTDWGEDAYLLASDDEKADTEIRIKNRILISYIIVLSIFLISLVLGHSLVGQKGWVDKNITNNIEETKAIQQIEEVKQDSIKDLAGFNSQADKDKYFEELEKRWGN